MTDTFVEQFASSRKPEWDSQHLNTIRQGSRESLRNYIARFNKENVSISNLNTETVINAFRNGLHYGLNLRKELTNSPAKTLKMCWPMLGHKSGGTKTKNTRYQWVYPSNPVESLPIFRTKMIVDLSDHKEFLNEVMILIQMGIVEWKIDKN